MNKELAIQLMSRGAKLTHPTFTKDEWVSIVPGTNMMLTEDGYKTVSGEWWAYRLDSAFDKDWSIWEEEVLIEVEGKTYAKIKNIKANDHRYIRELISNFVSTAPLGFSDNDLYEYRLILQKKSKLSSTKRRGIVYRFNKNFKLIKK